MGILQVLGLRKPKAKGTPGGGPPEAGSGAAPSPDALVRSIGAQLDAAQADADNLAVAAIQVRLTGEVRALRGEAAVAERVVGAPGIKALTAIDQRARTLAARAAKVRARADKVAAEVQTLAADPVADLDNLVQAQGEPALGTYQPWVVLLQNGVNDLYARLDKEDFDGASAEARKLQVRCAEMTTSVNAFAAEYPAYEDYRARLVAMIGRIRGGGMLDADGTKDLAEIEAAIGRADALGPRKGYAVALNSLNDIAAKAKKLRESNKAYQRYQPEHNKVKKLIDGLRKHKQKDHIKAELKDLDNRLKAADKLSWQKSGGSLKALTALGTLTLHIDEVRRLADELDAAAAQLPEITKKLTEGGVDKKKVKDTARYALKVLVEEACSADDAIQMAKDASGFVDEGLPEQDAIMSSRVKKSLVDSGIAEDHARSIGKNVRASGSASAEDAKAVGAGMARISKKAIDNLNAAGIQTACCRGPATEVLADLAGEQPRGWPDTMTWDDVPGCYSPDTKKVIVGTMDDGSGNRKVPGPGEGPIPHGTPDLIGHEAGHAFDASDGTYKSTHQAFLDARAADVATGQPDGMYSVDGDRRDSYFMTSAEGGANDAGSDSETFAESFAMHFSGTSRWPALERFWAANPWGV